jgi:hypothetical protein
MQTPGTPAEINFLRRLRKLRVDIWSVVFSYCFVFHSQIKVDYCSSACFSDVGQSNADIGVEKTRKVVRSKLHKLRFPSVDKFPCESYVKVRRHSKCSSFVPSTIYFQINDDYCFLIPSTYGGKRNVGICALRGKNWMSKTSTRSRHTVHFKLLR